MKAEKVGKIKKITPFDIFLVVFFVIYSLIMVFPFYNAFIISIVPESHYINNPISLYPSSITLDSYREVVEGRFINFTISAPKAVEAAAGITE